MFFDNHIDENLVKPKNRELVLLEIFSSKSMNFLGV